MKKISLAFTFCVLLLSAGAQSEKSEMDMIREVFGKEWKTLSGEALSLNTAEAEKFWPIWDQYRSDRKSVSDTRMGLIKNYADNYENMTDAKATELAKGVLKNESDLNKLKSKYFKKMSKAVSPIRAAQFLQLENYLDNQIKAAVSDELPFLPHPVK